MTTVWVVTDETPHRESERDEPFGVGVSVFAVFSTKDTAVEYTRLQAGVALQWEDDSERILIGPDELAYSVLPFEVDAEIDWIIAHKARRMDA